MSGIYGVEILDGNGYQVQYSENSNSVTGQSFDTVFSEISSEKNLDEIFKKVAEKYNIDLNLLKAVAYAESGFDTNAVSSAGAEGIMQLMPFVSKELGVSDPFDASQSIDGGARLLSRYLEKYDGNISLSLAAYNAGEGAVSKYQGVPPYKETINYINKINDLLNGGLDMENTSLEGINSQKEDLPSTKIYNKNLYAKNMIENYLNSNTLGLDDSLVSSYLNSLSDKELKGIKLSDNSENYSLNTSLIAMSNKLNQNDKNILKTDPYSLYEASASVISPILTKLMKLD